MVQILHHTELNIFHMSANNNKTISFYITSIAYFSSLQAAKKAYDIKKCAAVSARVTHTHARTHAHARAHAHTHTHTYFNFSTSLLIISKLYTRRIALETNPAQYF